MAILCFACVPMQTLHIAVILHQTCMPVMSHMYKSVSTALPVYIYIPVIGILARFKWMLHENGRTAQGGSTMFKNFGRKLRMEVQHLVDARLGTTSKGVPVTVTRHRGRDVSVWTGGSLFSVLPDFLSTCHTRAEYEEQGPSICWSDSCSLMAL
jgi:hypothetical protein